MILKKFRSMIKRSENLVIIKPLIVVIKIILILVFGQCDWLYEVFL